MKNGKSFLEMRLKLGQSKRRSLSNPRYDLDDMYLGLHLLVLIDTLLYSLLMYSYIILFYFSRKYQYIFLSQELLDGFSQNVDKLCVWDWDT